MNSNLIIKYFRVGNPRTLKAKKNILAAFFLKTISIAITFLLVPLTLNYLNPTDYGIWLTLSSIIGWFGFFDIGLGNGLRNRLAEAFALNNYKLAKEYISTTYAILVIIIGVTYLIFLIVCPFLNWSKILNTNTNMATELSWIAIITFTFFSLRFIFQLIGVILSADQLPAYNNLFNLLGNFVALISIYIVTKVSSGSLLYISILYSASPVIILLFASIFFLNGKYKMIKPSINNIKFQLFRSLGGLGIKFFFLQIAAMVIFSTDNMIITQILGPKEVTPYNIAYKYFGIPILAFSIIITPYWSAFTDAITKNDSKWMKSTIKRLIKTWLLIVLAVVLMLIFSSYFYIFWIGDKVVIPFLLSLFMGVYAIIVTWNTLFSYCVNGIGKIKIQMYDAIFGMIINIPISIYFAKYLEMGSSGVILGTCFSMSIGSFLIPAQTFKIINGKALGIWNK